MTILPNDKLIFEVYYRNDNGDLIINEFQTFASAAGHASALNGKTRFIAGEFNNETSSWCGTMYCINKNNERRAVNKYFLKQVLKFLAKQSDEKSQLGKG